VGELNHPFTLEDLNMADNKPAHHIRIHSVEAAIWANDTANGTRYNVTLCRIFKDGDNWRSTDGLGRDDLLVAAKVLDMAHTWVCENTQ
jgi:hypothetical protein